MSTYGSRVATPGIAARPARRRGPRRRTRRFRRVQATGYVDGHATVRDPSEGSFPDRHHPARPGGPAARGRRGGVCRGRTGRASIPAGADNSEFVLEDPAVVDELLTAPPPAPVKPVAATPTPAATAAAAAPTAGEPARETRVPLVRTASLSAAATKVAATKLAAANRRTTDVGAPKPVVPTIPVAQPAPAPAAAKPAVPKAAGNSNEGLAGWTNARATATVAPKPKSAPALAAGAGCTAGSAQDGAAPSGAAGGGGVGDVCRSGAEPTGGADGPRLHRPQPGRGAIPVRTAAAQRRHRVRAILSASTRSCSMRSDCPSA